MNKKLLWLVGIGCSLLLLVGCESTENNKENENNNDNATGKTLTCSMDFSESMQGLGTMEMKLVVDYNEDGTEPKQVTMIEEIVMTSEDVTDEVISTLATSLEDQTCTEEFQSCAATIDGKKVTLKAVGDMSVVTGEETEEDTRSYDATKEYFESMGYTCK